MTLLICQWKFSSTHYSFWNEKQQLKYKYQKQKLREKQTTKKMKQNKIQENNMR